MVAREIIRKRLYMNEGQINIIENADKIIQDCLTANHKSFFLFAGAGSGKTRSLINALIFIRDTQGPYLRTRKKKVAIITYTNAACEEIKHRLDFDSHFQVSTIHSFVWEIIKSFQADIKKWVIQSIHSDISQIEIDLTKGKPGTKTHAERIAKLQRRRERLKSIDKISQFIYSPVGDNNTKDSLNHTEVIKIAANFLNRPLMKEIVVQKFPILFIDESQDTNKELIDALFRLEETHSSKFLLGLFGDTMQRIYNDGKDHLEKSIPGTWKKPVKKINYRCPNRIVNLINKIRSNVDDQVQVSKDGQIEGFVRLFIVKRNTINKSTAENQILKEMSQCTSDVQWLEENPQTKLLILEHHMAARRLGFEDLFEAFYKVESIRTGLLDGSFSGLRFFTSIIAPLVYAHKNNDKFGIARIVKNNNILFDKRKNDKNSQSDISFIATVNESVLSLMQLWRDGNDPKLIDIVNTIHQSNLFTLPEIFNLIVQRNKNIQSSPNEDDDSEKDELIAACDKALLCKFSEVQRYHEYISEGRRFATHQGVKGLEFDRVMVIIDDDEARGFMFKYDKLFLTPETLPNHDEKETTIDRARRLFYVACSRAKKSLAVVAYTDDTLHLKENMISRKWFKTNEVILIE